jgi:tetratricopeptide (TPR) repeat protein
MGLALAHLGRLDEAVEHFMKALEVRPDYREAYDNLNVLYNKIKIIPKASVNP